MGSVERTSRRTGRLRRLAAAGVLTVAASTALVACSGSSGGSGKVAAPTPGASSSPSPSSVLQGNPDAILASAANRSAAAKNARVDLTGAVSAGGQTVNLSGTGAIDFANQTFQLTLSFPSVGQVEERLVDKIVYLRVPTNAKAQFGNKPWLKI